MSDQSLLERTGMKLNLVFTGDPAPEIVVGEAAIDDIML